MVVEKIKPYKRPITLQENQQTNFITKRGYQTSVSILMSIMAIGVMTYISIRNIPEDWGWTALMQAGWGAGGYITMQLITGQGIFPKRKLDMYPKFNDISPMVVVGHTISLSWWQNFGLALALGLFSTLLSQFILGYFYAITYVEQAFYFIFASVCEELFFRGMIIETFLSRGEQIWKRILAILTSATFFAWVHFQYHNQWINLLSVFIVGLVLATDYAIFRNISAVIMIHFILNAIATRVWLLTL